MANEKWLREQLKESDVDIDGLSLKQMEEIVAVILASKEGMKNNPCYNRKHETPKSVLFNESEMQQQNKVSKSNSVSPNTSVEKDLLVPSVTDSYENVNPGKQCNIIESNNSIKDSSPNKNTYASKLRKKQSGLHSYGTHGESKIGTTDRNRKQERWTLNPLNSVVDDNDIPLTQIEKFVVEDRMPFKLCKNSYKVQELQFVLCALETHLNEMAGLRHKWRSYVNETELQWGSPIQVDVDRRNEEINSVDSVAELPGRLTRQRAAKRKATNFQSILSDTSSSENENEKEVLVNKKKKSEIPSKSCSPLSVEIEKQLKSPIIPTKDNMSEDEIFENKKTNSVIDLQRELHDLRKSMSPEYPRRIIPPKPATRKKYKKKQEVSMYIPEKDITSVRKCDFSLEDNEWSDNHNSPPEKQNTDDECHPSTSEFVEDVELKPLSISLSARLQRQTHRLKTTHVMEKEIARENQEEAHKIEEEEKNKRREKFQRDYEEENEKLKLLENLQKTREEESRKWNEKLKLKEKITKSKIHSGEQENRLNSGVILLTNDETSNSSDPELNFNVGSSREKVNCPICNSLFDAKDIEEHASQCEQYSGFDEDTKKVRSVRKLYTSKNGDNEILECHICSSYRTDDLVEFSDHVIDCLDQQRARADNAETRSVSINDVTLSPIRSFKSISELSDSEIDYVNQFKTKSKRGVAKRKKR